MVAYIDIYFYATFNNLLCQLIQTLIQQTLKINEKKVLHLPNISIYFLVGF